MECFGTYADCKNCRSCTYSESCLWSSQNPCNDNRLGFVSFSPVIENVYLKQLCLQHPSEEENSDVTYNISHLNKLLTVIDTLDEYTLKILGRIITISDTSIHSLTEWRGCSRQSIHEKMLFAARKFPFIAGVFELTTRRMPSQNTKIHWIKQQANKEVSNG